VGKLFLTRNLHILDPELPCGSARPAIGAQASPPAHKHWRPSPLYHRANCRPRAGAVRPSIGSRPIAYCVTATVELLESGKLRVGDGPTRGHGDRTQAQIHDLKRKIAMNVALLESYR
jgi:hypothetical protein